jgi:enamine deaminase RidA (YjgF/YER057c/UK114 family)
MLEHIQPDGLFPSERLGFTQVVAARPGRTIYVSGQTACDGRGRPVGVGDVATQAGVALENLGIALAAAGARPVDVTMLRAYIVGYTPAIAGEVGARIAQFFSGTKPPASTWVGVQALFHPDFLIEIEAVAVVPDR